MGIFLYHSEKAIYGLAFYARLARLQTLSDTLASLVSNANDNDPIVGIREEFQPPQCFVTQIYARSIKEPDEECVFCRKQQNDSYISLVDLKKRGIIPFLDYFIPTERERDILAKISNEIAISLGSSAHGIGTCKPQALVVIASGMATTYLNDIPSGSIIYKPILNKPYGNNKIKSDINLQKNSSTIIESPCGWLECISLNLINRGYFLKFIIIDNKSYMLQLYKTMISRQNLAQASMYFPLEQHFDK